MNTQRVAINSIGGLMSIEQMRIQKLPVLAWVIANYHWAKMTSGVIILVVIRHLSKQTL